MQAVRITADSSKTYRISPLALPSQQRKGELSPEGYRRQAQGAIPRANFNPNPADSVRAIALSDGKFTGLASRAGTLLTFVVSGDVTVIGGSGEPCCLQPGDVLLTDEKSASIPLEVRDQCRLMQIGVPADWPPAGSEVQQPGTRIPRPPGRMPKLKRINKGEDGEAYFSEFSELFPETLDQWSDPHAVTGFRMICWEDGYMDLHPCVTNQLAIALAGEMEMGVGGGAVEVFHAGDVCLAEDRTGEGHSGRFRGVVHVVIMVLDTENLW